MPNHLDTLIALFAELRRRRVVRSALVYLGGAFVVLSVADVVVETYRLPDAVQLGAGILVILGFPVALVLSWLFDWTEGEIRRAGPEPLPPGVRPALVRLGLAVAVVVSAGAVVGLVWPEPSEPPPVTRPVPSLAILPFERISDSDSLAWLAPAVEARLEDALSTSGSIRLRSRRAVAAHRGAPLDSLARALGVDYFVQAQVGDVGGALQVIIQLLDARTSTVLSSGTVRPADNAPTSLVAGVTEGMERVLRPALGREIRLREWRTGTDDARAFEIRHRASEHRARGESKLDVNPALALDELAAADSLLAESERRDPKWVEVRLARADLADRRAVAGLMASRGLDVDGVTAEIDRGIGHADGALRLRPGLPEALAIRGRLRYRKALYGRLDDADRGALVDLAEDDLRAALSEEPDLPKAAATLSAVLFRERSAYEEAWWFAEQAYRLDAYLENSSEIINRIARSALELGDDRSAAEWCREGVRRFPDSPVHHGCVIEVMAWGDGAARPDLAWEHYRRLLEGVPPGNRSAAPVYRLAVAAVLARAGLADSARVVLDDVLDRQAASPTVPPSVLHEHEAAVRFRLGDIGRGRELWERIRRDDPDYAARVAERRHLRGFLAPRPG